MSWWYKKCLRPQLFRRDAETAHDLALRWLGRAAKSHLAHRCARLAFGSQSLPVECLGLTFPNPVGVAAGLDKHASGLPMWESLGFGFCEMGGVTWLPQPGNPAPRMFRAPSDHAIINRMGFNNEGAETLAHRLAQWRADGFWPNHPVGINLGKSKVTPLEDAAQDYARSFGALRDFADFFVVNVSSPNTPGLRTLQDKSALDDILAAMQQVNTARVGTPRKPVLVKVSPDLTFQALDSILDLVEPRDIAGLVATNTTTTRPTDPPQGIHGEAGGLSGRPLASRSTEVVRHLWRQTRGRLPIIGVGGIFTAEDAWEKITAGASLVQVYTGLVYEGPGLARSIVRGLRKKTRLHGMKTLKEAIGSKG